MQDTKRASDLQAKKKSRDAQGATLWMRDEAERANGSLENSRDSELRDTPLPLAASEYAEAAQPAEGASGVMSAAAAPDASEPHASEHDARAERVQDADFVELIEVRDVADATPASDGDGDAASSTDYTRDAGRATASPEPTTPSWMTIALAVAVLAAAWSLWSRSDAIASLDQAQARISQMSQAKASADRALSEAQNRLSAAEKAFADVKSALAGTPPAAAGAAAKTPAP